MKVSFFFNTFVNENTINPKIRINMKNLGQRIVVILLFLIPGTLLFSQTKIYAVTSGEFLFQTAQVSFTEQFMQDNPSAELVGNPLRFTLFLHLGQYMHFDFTDNLGLYSGVGMRNVGFISDERLDINNSGTVQDFKIIRRSYNLGVPLAIKIGSFKNNFYFFAGGEYELMFAYKEKYWNSHSRSGTKTKSNQWFGNQTPTFIPSVFAGLHFPGGIHLQFKYYLNNFINTNYTNPNNPISDLTRYKDATVMYVSLSWQFNTAYLIKEGWKDSDSDIEIYY